MLGLRKECEKNARRMREEKLEWEREKMEKDRQKQEEQLQWQNLMLKHGGKQKEVMKSWSSEEWIEYRRKIESKYYSGSSGTC
jgi:hypothetical protein